MTLDQALAILNKFEYFTDGGISRYPDQKQFDEAMEIIVAALNKKT